MQNNLIRLFLILTVFFQAGHANALELKGELIQGGMLVGQTAPGDQVKFNGDALQVSDSGLFVVGFDRDADLDHELVVYRSGQVVDHEKLTIKKRDYQIQRIDNLPKSKVEPPKRDWERIKRETRLVKAARKRNDARTDFAEGFVWPLHGPITGVYGSQRVLNGQPRRPHYGVDVAAPTGTPVRAPAAGVVTLAEDDLFFSGGTLIIDHGHNLSSSFLHLSKIHVRNGDRVEQGDLIAEVGATGRVTGAHLDWRMNLHKARIDPQLLVPPMPESPAVEKPKG